MNLPFGLKQKPLNHYFEHGLIRFSLREGVLGYMIIYITKDKNARLDVGIIKSKEQLDKLLSIKFIHEIPTIEEVVS